MRGKRKLTNTKTDTMQNYFSIALRSNVSGIAAMKSACMASMYHICGYHDNCPKFADTYCRIKRINMTTPTTTNQRIIYPLMPGEQFCLFINPFVSLGCWRSACMTKPKTLTNGLTG